MAFKFKQTFAINWKCSIASVLVQDFYLRLWHIKYWKFYFFHNINRYASLLLLLLFLRIFGSQFYWIVIQYVYSIQNTLTEALQVAYIFLLFTVVHISGLQIYQWFYWYRLSWSIGETLTECNYSKSLSACQIYT